MRKSIFIFAIGGILFSAGCAHLPAKSVSRAETQAMLDDFQARLAKKFEVLNSVAFKFRFFALSSLGLTAIDLAQERISVAGISPLGITLFQAQSVRGEIRQSFVAPELAKHGDVAKIVLENIRDIYFDLIPRQFISLESKGNRLYVKTASRDGSQSEYVFSESDRTLEEKRLYKNGSLFWSIFYEGWFADAAGNLYPRNIRFVQQAYQYQLLINIKEVRP
jgi:hypothetical protein